MLDVNVLIPAHREDDPLHVQLLAYVDSLRSSQQAYAVPELVLSAVVRIVTGKGFAPPTCSRHCLRVRPSESHWQVFQSLAREIVARGKLVPDAYLAALAIDQNFEFITLDGDYAKFPGLTWRHSLKSKSVTNPR